jgi:putative DNA primase/helicase
MLMPGNFWMVIDRLDILPSRGKRVPDYLAAWQPTERILSAKRLGWMEDPSGALSFVMPDRVITRDGNKQVVFQPDRYSPTVRTVHASGTVADWQTRVAAPVCRHRPMLFALCGGLAPALLAFAEAGDSFVIHFWGKTSRGKTTVGQISASPWGCAADPNDAPSLTFIRRWNVTGNGLEGLAESHSDMPLVLDELGSSTVGDIRPLIYQLAGGQGKTALNSAREMKEPRSWRTIAISTGELSLHARMSDPAGDGTKTRTVKGGLTHRALDIEIADIAEASPASEREAVVSGVKIACARTYGTAGPELVRLIAERFESASAVRQYVREQIADVSADLIDRQLPAETARAVRRFALIAVAGEFAAHAGLIPVEASEVRAAVKEVVTAWLGASAETDEERIVASVRASILKHESRFQRINAPDPEPKTDRFGNEYQPTARDPDPVRDRVGYVDRKAGKWMFTDAGLVEAAPGNDKTTIARTIQRAGFLHTNDPKKLVARVSIENSRVFLYAVNASILDAGAECARPLSKNEGHQGHQGQAQQPRWFTPVPDHERDKGQEGHNHSNCMDITPPVPAVPESKMGQGQAQTQQPQGRVPGVPAVPVKTEAVGKNPEIDDDKEAF